MRSLLMCASWVLCAPALTAQVSEKVTANICGAVSAGKPYKAIKQYKAKAADITTTDVQARTCYAEALNQIGDHAGAERMCRRTAIASTSPANGPLDLQWGIALNGLARFDSAEVLLWSAAKAGLADRTSLPLAIALQGRRRFGEAVALLDKVIARDGTDVKVLRERGACRSQMGDSLGARLDLDRAIELDPRDPVSWNSRGFHRWAAFGEHALAIKDYDRAIKLNPNYSFAFNNRGWSRYKMGDTEKAIKDIELAARKKAGNPLVSRNLGVIALETGAKTACGYFQQALKEGFTERYGDEVKDLVHEHCGAMPQVPKAVPLPPSNAPGSVPPSNAPASPTIKSNAP